MPGARRTALLGAAVERSADIGGLAAGEELARPSAAQDLRVTAGRECAARPEGARRRTQRADSPVGADRLSRQRQDDVPGPRAGQPRPRRHRRRDQRIRRGRPRPPAARDGIRGDRRPAQRLHLLCRPPGPRRYALPAGRSPPRQRASALPAHCAGDQRPRRSRAHSLHALGRRLSRGVAASRPDRDDDRHDRGPSEPGALSRGDGAGGQRRPARAHQDGPGAGDTGAAGAPRGAQPDRARGGWRGDRCRDGPVRRRPGRLAAAAPAHRSRSRPRHRLALHPPAAAR